MLQVRKLIVRRQSKSPAAAPSFCLALSCGALYALLRDNNRNNKEQRQQRHYLHKGSSRLGLALAQAGAIALWTHGIIIKIIKPKKYYLYYTKMSGKKQSKEREKKQLIYDTKDAAVAGREGWRVEGAWRGVKRADCDCAVQKCLYPASCPANPITYLDFMVIPTKSGSCRCSKATAKRHHPAQLPPGTLLRLPFYSRPWYATFSFIVCESFCILHLTCHCVYAKKGSQKKDTGLSWLASVSVCVWEYLCVCLPAIDIWFLFSFWFCKFYMKYFIRIVLHSSSQPARLPALVQIPTVTAGDVYISCLCLTLS